MDALSFPDCVFKQTYLRLYGIKDWCESDIGPRLYVSHNQFGPNQFGFIIGADQWAIVIGDSGEGFFRVYAQSEKLTFLALRYS